MGIFSRNSVPSVDNDSDSHDYLICIRSYKSVKIEHLKDSLAKMDSTRYKNIVLHVGGNNIDSKISANLFREKYSSLIEYLKEQGIKYVSDLFSKTDVKQFNDILKHICEILPRPKCHLIRINNHYLHYTISTDWSNVYFKNEKMAVK